jgi:zinc protease
MSDNMNPQEGQQEGLQEGQMTEISNPQEGLHTLDNGLQVLIVPTNSSVTTLNITYSVGSRNEGLCQTGDTHILEHMMFGGSKNYSGSNGMWRLEEMGAVLNATTYLDRTNYFEVIQTSYIEDALDREADRMLQPLLAATKLKSEMTVVRNEYERGRNNLFGRMNSKMMNCAFLEHPYGHSTIGYLSDIEHVTAGNLQDYHHKFYKPNNATLIMTGNIPKNALEMVKQRFQNIPKGSTADIYVHEPVQNGMRRFYESGQTGIVGIGFKAPHGLHPDAIELELLAYNINNNGIFNHLIKNSTLFNVSANWQRTKDPFLFSIWANCSDPEKAEQAIWDVIQAQPSFNLPKNAVKNIWNSATESSQGMAAEINEAVARGDWRDVWCRHDVLEECDGSNIWKYLVPEQATVGIMMPGKIPQQMPAGNYQAYEPQLERQTTVKGELFETPEGTFTHSNNIHLRIEYQSDAPEVINSLYADMITKGCGKCDAKEIQQLMGSHGVIRETEATPTGYALCYHGPESSLNLIMEELQQPRFSTQELKDAIKQHAQGLYIAQTNPDKLVMSVLKHNLYGTPMPATDLEHLTAVTSICKATNPTKITAAAPITAIDKIKQLHVPGFTSSHQTPLNAVGNTHVQVDKSSCAVAWGCHVQNSAPMMLAASALGSGFAGRLMKDVRDKRGLTYGINAGIRENMFIIKSSFNPTLLKQGVDATEKIVAEWRHGISSEELAIHKQMILGKRAVMHDSLDMYIKFVHCSEISSDDIRSVTLDEINHVLGELPELFRVTSGPGTDI